MKQVVVFLFIMSALVILSACQSFSRDSTDETTSYNAEQVTSSDAPISSDSPSTTEPSAFAEVIVISQEEAKKMMDAGEVIIVDVRREDEYSQGHIPNAILVPNETIETEAHTALPDKNAVYLIYCRSGRRSNEAAHKLIALGYQHIYDFGGILSWEYGTVTDE